MRLSEQYRRQIKELIDETGISLHRLHKLSGVNYGHLHAFINYGQSSVKTDWLDRLLTALASEKRKQPKRTDAKQHERRSKKSRRRPYYAAGPRPL